MDVTVLAEVVIGCLSRDSLVVRCQIHVQNRWIQHAGIVRRPILMENSKY